MYMHKHMHAHTYTHTQVDSAWNSGDQEGAKRSAQIAKKMNIAAVVFGIIIVMVGVITVIIGVAVPLSLAGAAVTNACRFSNIC